MTDTVLDLEPDFVKIPQVQPPPTSPGLPNQERKLLQKFCVFFFPQSVINKELSENLLVYDDGFELDSEDMAAIFKLHTNKRKLIPLNTLKSGEVVYRDGKSRHFPYHFEEPQC